MSTASNTCQESTPEARKTMHCYARLLAHRPYSVIAAVSIVATTCVVISLVMNKLPSFQDPQMGFEPRGTVLAQRETAWANFMEATKLSGPLTMNPNQDDLHRRYGQKTSKKMNSSSEKRNQVGKVDITLPPIEVVVEQKFNFTHMSDRGENITIRTASQPHFPALEEDNYKAIMDLENGGELKRHHEQEHVFGNESNNGFFCGNPMGNYAHVVFRSMKNRNLFTTEALKSMCRLEASALRNVHEFPNLCERNWQEKCCRSWSIGSYVAMLTNRSSCSEITSRDVKSVLKTLKACARFYYNLQLQSDCEEREQSCHGIPVACYRHNAIYNMLHYLMDTNFLNPTHPKNGTLTYAMVFLPIACSEAALSYFKSLERANFADGVTQIIAMELGLKNKLFDEYLINDTVFIGLAGGVILLFMWMYTSSFFITIMTVIAIAFSLGIAYFLYTLIFKIKFFPFMNLLTTVIIIGIGADDAFIYCKVWASAKSEKNNGTLVKLVNDTLRHAILSMFVTSLTTAAAFYASFVSDITAIRCFSVFAGTTVLANFLLSITWLPATVVIAEKWCSSNLCICIPPFGLYAPQLQKHRYCSKLCNALWKLHYHFTDWSRVFFEKILPCIVIKPRYLWVTLLGSVAMGGVFVVFYHPRLQLPDSSEFQLFASDHPFEQYDLVYKEHFWFERVKQTDTLSKLPIRIVWGVQPVDNGDYMDPLDKGSLVFDDTFNIAAPASQQWLVNFCRQLRNQSFYQSMIGALLPNCFIETFKEWMDRRCEDPIYERNRSPCCEKSRFPYSEEVFNVCLKEAMKSLYETPGLYFLPGVAGPRFSRTTRRVAAMVIEYDSRYSFTFSYKEMHEFVTQVENWVQEEMAKAPPGVSNGWFVSYFSTYDLQDSLAYGTATAIGVAMAIAFVVLFLTTLNLLITLYAVATIACIIFVTVGSLVLLGWKLNLLESVTVSVAIGLAVDFTLHYGVIYKLCPEQEREASVVFSLARMGSPIAMAALTTFLAGLFMLPSTILGYIQIGTFIILVMTTSWIYSTLFFQSLLRLFGPQKRFGQFRYPSLDCCTTSSAHVDKTVYSYALSESTMSTSSIGFPVPQTNPNESHELEPLTVLAKLPDRLAVGGHRYVKHKNMTHSKGARQRSGSLSVVCCERDPGLAVRSNRKVSLPTGSIDPSPRHVSIATSSTTMVFSDEGSDQPTA